MACKLVAFLASFYTSQNGDSTFWVWETQFPDGCYDLILRESFFICSISFCLAFTGTYELDLWDS